MQDFRNLKVWQRSHRLTLELYRLTADFPPGELYGVVSQIRRAAVSIPTNLAEGSKRRQRRDYAHFINMAEASLAELEYLVILSRDLGYLGRETAQATADEMDELARMLRSLHQRVSPEPSTLNSQLSTLNRTEQRC